MLDSRRKILKSSFGVAVATLLSRILGLARVMLEARVLGGGIFASAWGLAFMVPNLFRRILGEGALGSALIPIISGVEAEEGEQKVRYNLTVVFAVLSIILLAIVLVVTIFSWIISGCFSVEISSKYEHVKLALKLLPIVMPYAFFICLIGVCGSILNAKRVFFLPALGALLLNVMLIGMLLYGYRFMLNNREELLNYLGVTVLVAGAVHLALMMLLLWKHGRMPLCQLAALKNSKMLHSIWQLTLPGVLGASATQVSFLVDRSLAAWLGPEAVPALNYTERLVYLPIGVFALALGSVLLADMSKAAARGDREEFLDDLVLGLRHVYFVCVPLAAYMIFFRTEIISLLFAGGNFKLENVQATAWATLFYALGIPVFCAQKVIIPAFHSRKEMKTPLKVALWAIGLNVVLNLILMWPLKQGGLALATVLSASFNNLTLIYILRKQGFMVNLRPVMLSLLKILLAAAAATLVARFLYDGIADWHLMLWKAELVPLLSTAAIFAVVYSVCAGMLRCPEIGENLNMFLRRK